MQKNSIFRVVLFGPESTGKTTLARELAAHFQTSWAPEFMREFCEREGRLPLESDMPAILSGQLRNQEIAEASAKEIVFFDTDPLQLEVYHSFYFGPPLHLYETPMAQHADALYLLTDIDLQWEPDPLRDENLDRKELLEIFRNSLVRHDRTFEIIAGKGRKRLEDALAVLKMFQTRTV